MNNRRDFLKKASLVTPALVGGTALIGQVSPIVSSILTSNKIKPLPLKKGAVIGTVAPGGAIFSKDKIDRFKQKMSSLGYSVREGKTLHSQHGYLSATDEERARDFMSMYKSSSIDAIITMRGGSGTARILPLLDYDYIRANPKPVVGMSDITALLLALQSQCNLISYHGPVGYSSWSSWSMKEFNNILTGNHSERLNNTNKESIFYTIAKGNATGELTGGNLTVFCELVGTKYLPNMKGKILFLEDLNEEPYRIDRMLTQLKLAGILNQLNGIILGEFKKCTPEEPEKSLTLKQVFQEHLGNLGIPVFYGAPFGHIKDKWTLPLGIQVKMDASTGHLTLLEKPTA